MSRLALSCTVLFLALTAVAFVHDRRARTAPAPAVLPEVPAAPPPHAAAASMPEVSTRPRPSLSPDDLTTRIERDVLAPLRGPQGIVEFSRDARPMRRVRFRWVEAPTSAAPTPRFEILKDANPFSRSLRGRKLATGLIDRSTGRIRLSVGPDEHFVDLKAGLAALRVD